LTNGIIIKGKGSRTQKTKFTALILELMSIEQSTRTSTKLQALASTVKM